MGKTEDSSGKETPRSSEPTPGPGMPARLLLVIGGVVVLVSATAMACQRFQASSSAKDLLETVSATNTQVFHNGATIWWGNPDGGPVLQLPSGTRVEGPEGAVGFDPERAAWTLERGGLRKLPPEVAHEFLAGN